MVGACADMLTFVGTPSIKINAEYLFTLNVAKAIARLNYYCAEPYKILLEKKTKVFAKDCLHPIVFGHPVNRGSAIFRGGTPKINRNGRIDVAVYVGYANNTYIGHQPLCAIELKAFNPQRKPVLDDLKRNLEYFRLTGPTGTSVISLSLFAALHSFTKQNDEQKVDSNEKVVKAQYQKCLSELWPLDDVGVDVEAFTVSKALLGEIIDEEEYKVLDTNACHHFVGAVVSFTKKSDVHAVDVARS